MKRVLAFIPVLILMAIACSWTDTIDNPATVVVNTLTVTTSVSSTQHHTPTLTPKPSSTFRPTPTDICPPQPSLAGVVAAVQERTEALIPGAKVVWYDDFICQEYSYGWWTPNNYASIKIVDSILTIQTRRIPDSIGALIRNAKDLYDNNGVLVLFRYSKGSSITLLMDAGIWQDETYRGWAFSVNGDNQGHNYWNRWTGKYLTTDEITENILKPDNWYYLFIRLEKKGGVTLKVWQKENPIQNIEFHLILGNEWVGRNWKMQFQVPGGILEVDEYWQLIFSKLT
jgi:hypothetical protein